MNKRGGLKGVITQILPRLKTEVESKNLPSVSQSLAEVELYAERIKELDSQILDQTAENAETAASECLAQYEFHKSYANLLFQARELLKTQPEPVIPKKESSFRLSKLDIPKFDGSILDFQSWWDQYEVAVHTNTGLSPVEKFVHLRSLLTSEASLSIDGFPLTAGNYDEAITLLTDRYGKKSKLISAHVSKLLSIDEITGVNPKNLRRQFDLMESQVRSLSTLNVTSDMYGCILLPILLSKIPTVIRLAWNRTDQSKVDVPNVHEFLTFLKTEIVAREEAGASFISTSGKKLSPPPRRKRPEHDGERGKGEVFSSASALNVLPKTKKCLFCEGEHWSSQCYESDKFSKQERWNRVKEARACYLCLNVGHVVKDCPVASKVKLCQKCPSRHNAVLCGRSTDPTKGSNNVNQSIAIVPTNTSTLSLGQVVVYQTVVVNVTGDGGVCRARLLFDSGAGRSFIRTSLSRKLRCRRLGNETLDLGTFGGGQTRLKDARIVQASLSPLTGEQEMVVSLMESDNLCCPIPMVDSEDFQSRLDSLGIGLTDRPGVAEDSVIQIVIGLDLFPSFFLPVSRRIREGLFAQKTKLGWSLWGNRKVNSAGPGPSSNFVSVLFLKPDPVDDNDLAMKSLWDLEGVGIRQDEVKVSEHPLLGQFRDDVSYVDGRYEVALPWVNGKVIKDSNLLSAERRYLQLEKRFRRDSELCERYRDVFRSYLTDHIIELIPENEVLVKNSDDCRVFYLPHRPVVKDSSLSTKVRPVFDGSAKNSEFVSLNECLETGPCLLPDLISVLLRFRQWLIGITADITKAFLQVGVRRSDRDVLRFLMRLDDSSDVQHYRFRRVPFGLCCSPFLLNATIRTHLQKDGSATALKALRDLYVDDLVSGVDTVEEAERYVRSSQSIFQKAGMNLGKWRTTSDLFSKVEGDQTVEMSKNLNVLTLSDAKVLGLTWCQDTDELSLHWTESAPMVMNTKRRILKIVAQIFDPLGFVAPFVVVLKILFQRLWVLSLDWDDLVPDDIEREASRWFQDFLRLKIQVPRKYFYTGLLELAVSGRLQIHVFSDASLKAYGSVVFFRALCPDGLVRLSFVMAKPKVAPLKAVTLPRLELLAALVGSRLCAYVRKSLVGLESVPCFFWSDSQIVLSWINSHPSQFKIFVSNRVAEIQSLSSPTDWRFCRSENNPADVISRGCSLDSLDENSWLCGPRWLLNSEGEWNSGERRSVHSSLDHPDARPELKVHVGFTQVMDLSRWSWLKKRHSCFTRLVRVVAWLLRFKDNARAQNVRTSVELGLDELATAQDCCLRWCQMESFPEEYSLLQQGNSISKSSPLWVLNPRFHVTRKLLCVSTRLDFSHENPDFVFPIILSHRCRMTELIISDVHVRSSHAGVQLTLMELRRKFWCLKGRRTVRSVIQRCLVCKRFSAKSFSPSPAPLPRDRVVLSPPFTITGVDYAGPLYITGKEKVYLCLFTCATTRAVHFELCESLLASDFLMAFTRFISRRGQPKKVYSDNGTHFRCGDRLLKEEFDRLSSSEVHDFCVDKAIEWIFIPPASPWWGGWWERLVGLVKRLLVRILGHSLLSLKELHTIVCCCESIINRRPLTYLYDDPDCLLPLSPSHFLLPRTGGEPDFSVLDVPFSGSDFRKRYRLKESLLSSFFSRWSREYLGELRNFHRESDSFHPQEGQVVLIECEGKRQNWPIGIIETVFPGRDNLVRVARVRTSSGHMIRPVQKLYSLEIPEASVPEAKVKLEEISGGPAESDPSSLPSLEDRSESDPSPLPMPKNVFTRVGRKVRIPSRLDL